MQSITLQEDIQQQQSMDFTKKDIELNLLAKGFTQDEITQALASVPETTGGSSGGVSTKNILLGLLFVAVFILRLSRVASNKSGTTVTVLLCLGVFSAIGMAIYFFTKRSTA